MLSDLGVLSPLSILPSTSLPWAFLPPYMFNQLGVAQMATGPGAVSAHNVLLISLKSLNFSKRKEKKCAHILS